MPEPEPGGEEAPREPRAVAVKILRPGIERAFERDLEFFYWLAEWVERTQPKLRRFRPIEAVRVFEATVLLRSEVHTSELQSLMRNSYAVFCWNKKHTTCHIAPST